jgi:YfiH family protein
LPSDKKFESQDNITEQIKVNKELITNQLHIKEGALSILKQTHTSIAIEIESVAMLGDEIEADGQVTLKEGIALGILTADCVPILFADKNKKIIGAAHSGWKGARHGVIESTIEKMISKGSNRDDIIAVIGACIHQESYEVGPEFIENFLSEKTDNQKFFIPSVKDNHHMFNLPGYVEEKLKNTGIKTIDNINKNTYFDEENFFSFRRSTLRSTKLEGNLLSVIMIK